MVVQNRCKYVDTDVQQTHLCVSANGSEKEITNSVIKEHQMDIYVQDQLVFQIVCTPTDLTELVVGRLRTAGVIKTIEEIDIIDICEQGNRAKVYLTQQHEWKSMNEIEPTCCTDNKQFLQQDKENDIIEPMKKMNYQKEWIFHLAQVFSEGSMIHKKTKGTHCCYLAIAGDVKYTAEDIGRHNALDKAIGYALLHSFSMENCILFTTGRVPTDMVKKVAAARIPTLVSKAVPTDEAIILAKKQGMNLICKAWPDSFEVFS